MENGKFDKKIAISVNYPVTFLNSAAKFARYSEVPKSDPFTGPETGQRPFLLMSFECCSGVCNTT